ncbi:MAG: acetyltransferase [Ostreibacterium sp.]
MLDLILIGGGGHCCSVIDVIEQEQRFRIAGIVDKEIKAGEKIMGYEVIGDDSCLSDLASQYQYAMITIGHLGFANVRVKLFELLTKSGFTLPTIISPRAYVARTAILGEGTIIMHDALINANATIGRNCIVNTKALIEHDATIGDHCHVSTAAVVNGEVIVEAGAFIGSNAVTKQAITILNNRFIKAGSVVK